MSSCSRSHFHYFPLPLPLPLEHSSMSRSVFRSYSPYHFRMPHFHSNYPPSSIDYSESESVVPRQNTSKVTPRKASGSGEPRRPAKATQRWRAADIDWDQHLPPFVQGRQALGGLNSGRGPNFPHHLSQSSGSFFGGETSRQLTLAHNHTFQPTPTFPDSKSIPTHPAASHTPSPNRLLSL